MSEFLHSPSDVTLKQRYSRHSNQKSGIGAHDSIRPVPQLDPKLLVHDQNLPSL